MLGKHIFYSRFKLPRFHYGSKFEDKQRDLRRDSMNYFNKKTDQVDEELDPGHSSRPRVFNRSL